MSEIRYNKIAKLCSVAHEYRSGQTRNYLLVLLRFVNVIAKMDERDTKQLCELISFGDRDGEG